MGLLSRELGLEAEFGFVQNRIGSALFFSFCFLTRPLAAPPLVEIGCCKLCFLSIRRVMVRGLGGRERSEKAFQGLFIYLAEV